jgi:hypothetical protein
MKSWQQVKPRHDLGTSTGFVSFHVQDARMDG